MATAPELCGRRLGAFQLEAPLGKGGMGAVFRGRDTTLDRPVAIKVLAPHLAEDREYVERFVREARTAARLNHPNVVQVYGAGSEAGTAFIALELVEGATLHALLERHRPFPVRRACELIRDAARGLAAAHALGIVHRDLKPENVLVAPGGQPKLADFGLARSSNQRITATGMFLGTPQYASPEQCNGDDVGPASDLYSLGVVLYELLAGRPPHEAPTPLVLFRKIMTEAPAPLDDPRLPVELRGLVAGLLVKDPAQRGPGAEGLAAALDAIAAELPAPPPSEDPFAGVSRGPAPVAVASATTAAIVPTPAGTTDLASRETTIEGGATQLLEPGAAPLPLPGQTGSSAARPSTPVPVPSTPAPGRALGAHLLSGAAALALLILVGVLAWRGLPDGQLGGSLEVAILPWKQGTNEEDFAWLGEALPEFVRSELSSLAPRVSLIPADEVARALEAAGPGASEREVLAALGGDLWIGGRYYAVGEEVGIATRVGRLDGRDARGGGQLTFPKAETLSNLNDLAAKLRVALSELIGRERVGPPPGTVVAAAPPPESEDEAAQGARFAAEGKQGLGDAEALGTEGEGGGGAPLDAIREELSNEAKPGRESIQFLSEGARPSQQPTSDTVPQAGALSAPVSSRGALGPEKQPGSEGTDGEETRAQDSRGALAPAQELHPEGASGSESTAWGAGARGSAAGLTGTTASSGDEEEQPARRRQPEAVGGAGQPNSGRDQADVSRVRSFLGLERDQALGLWHLANLARHCAKTAAEDPELLREAVELLEAHPELKDRIPATYREAIEAKLAR